MTFVLDTTLVFAFRDRPVSAVVFYSFEEEPLLIFVLLKDPDLFQEFGEELTLHTDCETVQFRRHDSPALKALKQTIFQAIRYTGTFLAAREKARC